MRKLPAVAIVYDFDGTLSMGNMQEHSFLPNIGMKAGEFWKLAERLSKVVLPYIVSERVKAPIKKVENHSNHW